MAKLLCVLVSLLVLQANGQLSASLSGRQRISQLGRDTASAGANVGRNIIGTAQDSIDTALGVGSQLAQTASSLGARRIGSLADTASNIATFSQTAVKTGVRIAQDAIKTGLNMAGRGVNAVGNIAPVGTRLASRGLNAMGKVTDRAADFLSDLEDLETRAVQRVFNASARAANTASNRFNSRLAGVTGRAQDLLSRGASRARNAIDRVTGVDSRDTNSNIISPPVGRVSI